MSGKKNTAQLLESAKRELAMRKKVYPGLIEQGRMKSPDASHELECQKEIIRLIKRQQLVEMGMPPGNMTYGDGIINRYSLTFGEYTILLVYVDGTIEAIADLAGPAGLRISEGANALTMQIPATINDIPAYQAKGWQIEEIPTLALDQKIEAFRAAYKAVTTKTYIATPLDRNTWNKRPEIGVERELLDLYLNVTTYPLNGPKTITDYLTHYSALPEMYERNRRDPDGLPFYFDARMYAHMEKHQPQLWMKYRKKLKDMGYREVTKPEGKTWEK